MPENNYFKYSYEILPDHLSKIEYYLPNLTGILLVSVSLLHSDDYITFFMPLINITVRFSNLFD